MQAISRQHAERLLYFFFIAFTLVFINVAWVAEDAFITFRAVDNFLKGYGPVWNVGERVQVYTHPLWYALLIVGIGLFKHPYWVTIALSYACLMATIHVLLKIAKSAVSIAQVVIALCVLLLSRAFMDYSSSGLENPLLHLLLACYVLIAIRQQDAAKRFLHASLLYSFIFLTRPDGIFIITPASLWMLWQARRQAGWMRTLKLAALAALPALAWEAFSLIYYGSLAPNTALAKVNIDYPRAVLLAQAKDYFAFNLQKDPITLGMALLSFALWWLNKNTLARLLMAGVALQMLYICHVGADYMIGRFLSPSIIVAAMAFMLMEFADVRRMKKAIYAGGGIVLLLFPQQMQYNLKYSPDFSYGSKHGRSAFGVGDEREFYYQALGVIPVIVKRGGDPYTHGFGRAYTFTRNAGLPYIGIIRVAGQGPWIDGEKQYWIDLLALTDPYLSRLPARPRQRIGHYERALPKGYLDTLVTGENAIATPALASLWDDVALAVRAPLWNARRWSAIWRLNTGRHERKVLQEFDRDDRTPWRIIIRPEWRHSEYDDFDSAMGESFSGRALAAGLPLAVPAAFSPFIQQPGAPAR